MWCFSDMLINQWGSKDTRNWNHERKTEFWRNSAGQAAQREMDGRRFGSEPIFRLVWSRDVKTGKVRWECEEGWQIHQNAAWREGIDYELNRNGLFHILRAMTTGYKNSFWASIRLLNSTQHWPWQLLTTLGCVFGLCYKFCFFALLWLYSYIYISTPTSTYIYIYLYIYLHI